MSDNIMPMHVLLSCFHCISNNVPSFRKVTRASVCGEAMEHAAVDGHARNRLAGWWSDPRTGQDKLRNTGELLMLAVSELGEIPPYPNLMDCPDDKLVRRLMVEVEIADCIIRLLDTAGARRVAVSAVFVALSQKEAGYWFLPLQLREMGWKDADTAFMWVVRAISQAMEGDRKDVIHRSGFRLFDVGIVRAIVMLFQIGNLLSLDVPGAMVDKIAFNSTREDHKREARLAPGGKAY